MPMLRSPYFARAKRAPPKGTHNMGAGWARVMVEFGATPAFRGWVRFRVMVLE